MSKEQRTLKST